MKAKEWRKVVFSDQRKSNLDGPDGFRGTGTQKNFPKKNYSIGNSGEGSLMIWEWGDYHH